MPDQTEGTPPDTQNPQTEKQPVAQPTVEQLRLAEYRQRRKVQLLRERVYSQPDPTLAKDFGSDTIAKAEAELHKLEKQRRELEAKAGKGVLIDTKESEKKPGGQMMGAETTGIDA